MRARSLILRGTDLNSPSDSSQARRILFWLVAANVVASIFHYVDNVINFRNYPEPTWLNPHLVDMAWFVMTPFGLAGCLLHLEGRKTAAYACLQIFAAMNLLVLGHYLIAPPWKIAFRINLFILLEAAAAVALAFYAERLRRRAAAAGIPEIAAPSGHPIA